MPERGNNNNNRDMDGETFKLKVEKICYDVFNERDVTYKETKIIKEALAESTSLLIAQHANACEKRRKDDSDRMWHKVYIIMFIISVFILGANSLISYFFFSQM